MGDVDGKTVRYSWLATTALTSLVALIPSLTVAQVITDGSTGPGVPLDLEGPDYQITDDLGTRAGDNLFHSFREFSIGTNQSATFSGPDEIENVISRVTGSNPSDIDGTLSSTMPVADFYFINPNGVTFGPNATLDVQGSFHVSTADELRFEGGEVFSAVNPDASGFSVAEPRAFGFFDADPGAILIDGSTLEVNEGETLSLVGGDITVDGRNDGTFSGDDQGLLKSSSGAINIISLLGDGEFDLIKADAESAEGGTVKLTSEAHIEVSGENGGKVRIVADQFMMDERSLVSADVVNGTSSAGIISVDANEITMRDLSTIRADVLGSGFGVDIIIAGETLDMQGGAAVRTILDASGRTGSIGVYVDEVSLTGVSEELVSTAITNNVSTNGTGTAGTITIQSESVHLTNLGLISGITFGEADGGALVIDADEIIIEGDNTGFVTGIESRAAPNTSGNGGEIQITSQDIKMRKAGSLISASSLGQGDAGDIVILSEVIDMSDFARISSEASLGRPGDIKIETGQLSIKNGSGISNIGVEAGLENLDLESGQIFIKANEFVKMKGISGNASSGILSVTTGSRNAGNIRIETPYLMIGSYSIVDTSTIGIGNAGEIKILVDDLLIDSSGAELSSGINSSAFDQRQEGDLLIPSDLTGNAGSVDITATNMIEIKSNPNQEQGGKAGIVTATSTAGRGGSIRIKAKKLKLSSGSNISTSSVGLGEAGNITLDISKEIKISSESAILTSSFFSGGGQIEISTPEILRVSENSFIQTSVFGGEGTEAGDINIGSDFLILDDGFVLANANQGRGGAIAVNADTLILSPRSQINAEAGPEGIDGTVVTSSPEVDLSGGLLALDSEFADASRLIRESCESGGDVGGSTFASSGQPPTVSPGDGLLSGFDPGSFLPGQLKKGNAAPVVLPCP